MSGARPQLPAGQDRPEELTGSSGRAAGSASVETASEMRTSEGRSGMEKGGRGPGGRMRVRHVSSGTALGGGEVGRTFNPETAM